MTSDDRSEHIARRGLTRGAVWGLIVAAVLIVTALATHSKMTYLIGIAVAALAVGALVLLLATVRGLQPRIGWGLAALATLAAGLPAGLLPWWSYHSVLSTQHEWEQGYDGTDTYVFDGRFYSLSTSELQISNAHTGEVLSRVQFLADTPQLTFGPGTVYVGDQETVTAYQPNGEKLWHRPGEAVAAIDTTTVVQRCPDDKGDPPCRLVGVDTATGAQRWSREMWIQWSDSYFRRPDIDTHRSILQPIELPAVIVKDRSIVDPNTGESVHQLPASEYATSISGNRVVQPVPQGDSCVMYGYQLGGQQWTSEPIPSRCPTQPSVLDTRLYFSMQGVDKDHPSATLDLTDGSWRRSYGVRLTSGSTSDWHTGVGGDDVIVYRDGPGKLFGVDADSGEELWRREIPGDRPAGITIDNGTVAVLTGADGDPLNPFVPEGQGYHVLILDAQSGETTGSWLGDWPWDTLPVDDGMALVLGDNRVWAVGRGA